jgi:DNA-binding NarL/FixJ family response regulator
MRAAAAEAAERFAASGWPVLEGVALALRDGVRLAVPLLAEPTAQPRGVASAAGAEEGETQLTRREREVARLVLDGLKNREIGAELRISEHTVEHHVTAVLAKLGLASRWQIRERARSYTFPDVS